MLHFRWNRALVVAYLLLSVGGCAKSPGNVSGKVTLDGKNVSSGSVIMAGADKIPKTAAIEMDGTFSVVGVTYGRVDVAVVSLEPILGVVHKLPPGMKHPSGKEFPQRLKIDNPDWFPIPESYGDLSKSEISVTVSQKETSFNIELKTKAEEKAP